MVKGKQKNKMYAFTKLTNSHISIATFFI